MTEIPCPIKGVAVGHASTLGECCYRDNHDGPHRFVIPDNPSPATYPCPSCGTCLGADQVNEDGENECPTCKAIGKAPDRCEACDAERGDGYCQECPDDPDRASSLTSG